jgi:hypothetical protein
MTGTVTQVQHRINIDLDQPQEFTDPVGRTRKVHAIRIEYGLSPLAHRVDVVVEYAGSAALIPPAADIPAWMQTLIDQYKPEGPACVLR